MVFSWAGFLIIIEEAGVNTTVIVAAVSALLVLHGTQAKEMAALHGNAVDSSQFPGGHWPVSVKPAKRSVERLRAAGPVPSGQVRQGPPGRARAGPVPGSHTGPGPAPAPSGDESRKSPDTETMPQNASTHHEPSRLTVKGREVRLRTIAMAVIAVLAVWFIAVNTTSVTITLWVSDVTMPLWVVLTVTILVGMLIGVFLTRRRAARKSARQ
ncbi:LapA family protein [Kitasatospora sp. NPDC097643]|uniref:LapA family protein n=1 Tax=Kitasatospora sp. NPDC097643 TaxID=3157230 RepID=UPI003321F673